MWVNYTNLNCNYVHVASAVTEAAFDKYDHVPNNKLDISECPILKCLIYCLESGNQSYHIKSYQINLSIKLASLLY